MTYLDLGQEIQASLDGYLDGVRLRTKVMQSSIAEERSSVGAQDAIIRQTSRVVFIGTVLNFSIATGLLYFTPDNGWVYLAVMRFFVGVGVGGLYCVDLPLVQEFMPSSKRGWVGGSW